MSAQVKPKTIYNLSNEFATKEKHANMKAHSKGKHLRSVQIL
jgi:hypothetical protein